MKMESVHNLTVNRSVKVVISLTKQKSRCEFVTEA